MTKGGKGGGSILGQICVTSFMNAPNSLICSKLKIIHQFLKKIIPGVVFEFSSVKYFWSLFRGEVGSQAFLSVAPAMSRLSSTSDWRSDWDLRLVDPVDNSIAGLWYCHAAAGGPGRFRLGCLGRWGLMGVIGRS